MKAYAEQFYKSKAWESTRLSYLKEKGGLCEKCLKAGLIETGVIVHHKIHITPENIHVPEIALCHDNLEVLCRKCHGERHSRQKRFSVDENGTVIPLL